MVYNTKDIVKIRFISKSKKTGKQQLGVALPQKYNQQWFEKKIKLIIDEENKKITLIPIDNIV